MTTISKEEAEERVARGMAWLDGLDDLGTDWPRKVDLDVLSIESCDRCILGQLDDDLTGVRTGPGWHLDTHGFWANNPEEAAVLDDAWRRAISARLATEGGS